MSAPLNLISVTQKYVIMDNSGMMLIILQTLGIVKFIKMYCIRVLHTKVLTRGW